MDTDLLTEALHLVSRGGLPGIEWDDDVDEGVPALVLSDTGSSRVVALESDLHLAAHNEIVRRGWRYDVMPETDEIVIKDRAADDGTTTLSLLRALRAACEEHERATQQASEKKETKP